MGELGINLPGLITQLISFSILLFLISKFLYKPVVKLLDERAEKIKIGAPLVNATFAILATSIE